METDNKHLLRWILIAALICILIAVLSAALPFLICLIPIITTIVLMKRGTWAGAITYIITLAAVFFLLGEFYLLLLIALSLPSVIAVPFLLKRKIRMYNSVLINAFVSVLGVFALIGYITYATGTNITELITTQIDQFFISNEAYTRMFYTVTNTQTSFQEMMQFTTSDAVASDIPVEEMRSVIVNTFSNGLSVFIPSAIVSYGLLSGFLSFFITHRWLVKRDTELVPAAAFKDLRMPRTSTTALAVMVIVSVVLQWLGLAIFANITAVLMYIFILVYSIQGIALFVFLYKMKRMHIITTIILITVGLFLNILFWIGFFESLFRIRDRIRQNMSDNGSL